MNSPWSEQSVILRNQLKDLRISANLTQEQLAILLDKPQSFVSKVESGDRSITLFEIRTICKICGVSFTGFIKKLDNKLSEANL